MEGKISDIRCSNIFRRVAQGLSYVIGTYISLLSFTSEKLICASD